LAERPTLARLLAGEGDGLDAYLEQYRRTARLGACSIARGPAPPARSIATGPAGVLEVRAMAAVPSTPGAAVVVSVPLDRTFEERLSEQARLSIAVVSAGDTRGDALAALRTQALAPGAPIVERHEGAYVALLPLRAPGGALAGAVEATLPTTEVD